MLLLKRKPTESIIIGDDIKVTVIKVHGDEVQLGVKAPNHVRIDREEVRADRTRRLKGGLVAAFFLSLAGLLQGADYVTVTGHVSSAQSQAYTNEYLTFTPDNNGPILNPPLLISALPVRTTSTPPVGFFEIDLEQGVYKVQIGRDRRNTFQITIPAETTETNHINQYVTAGASTNFQAGDVSGWTKSAANARFVSKSNSWSVNQILTNAFFKGSTNVFQHTNGAAAGYILKTDGEYAYWSAAGGGESTTGSNLSETNATTFGIFYRLNGTDLEHRTVRAGSNMVITNEGTNLVFASTASGSGGSTTGATNAVVVYSDTGTITEYLPSADTDAARGQALTNALDGASSGDLVSIGPGTYAFDTGFYYINTNKTLSIKGAGKNATMITADITSQGVVWNKLGGYLNASSLTFSNKNAFGAGLKNDAAMTLVDVRTAGYADGMVMVKNAQSPGDDTGASLIAYDTEFWTGWDGIAITSTNATADFYNCLFKGYAQAFTDMNGIGISSQGGLVRMFGGAVDLTYTNGISNSAGVTSSGTSTVELYGAKIYTDQGGAVASSDLVQSGSGVLKVSGTSYDVSNTSGTITPIASPHSVSGDANGIVVTLTTNSNGVIDFDLDIASEAYVTNLNHFGNITNAGNLYPDVAVSRILGNPTRQWFNVYSENYLGTNIVVYGLYQHQLATADRVAGFDGSKRLTNSANVDFTELDYLNNADRNIKTALDNLDGSTNALDSTVSGHTTDIGNLQAATNALHTLATTAQGGSSTLTNLSGTGAITNVVSLSTTNGTSKPLTNSYANGTLTLFGLEAGANVTLTPNGSNIVVAASGGSASTNFNTASFNSLSLSNYIEMDWRDAAISSTYTNLDWLNGNRQIITLSSNVVMTGPNMSDTITNREPMVIAFVQDGTGSHTFTHNGTTIPTRQGANDFTFITIYPGPDASTNVTSDVLFTVDGTVVDNFIDLDSGGEITVTDTSGTITWTIKDDIIAAANFADGDWGDVSVSGNSVTLDNDVVGTDEMADADHGFFTYSSGVASLDSGGLTSANLSGALTDETGSGSAVFGTTPTIATPTISIGGNDYVSDFGTINNGDALSFHVDGANLALTNVAAGGGSGDITAVGDVSSGAAFDGTAGTTLQFEGSTADGNEVSLTTDDPGADFTVTIPAATGYTPVVLQGYATPTYATNTTSETDVLNMTIPGGAMSTDRSVRVKLHGLLNNGTGAGKGLTVKIILGGETIFDETTGSSTIINSSPIAYDFDFTIQNAGSASAQWMGGQMSIGGVNTAETGYGNLTTDEISAAAVILGQGSTGTSTNVPLQVTFSMNVADASYGWTNYVTKVILE